MSTDPGIRTALTIALAACLVVIASDGVYAARIVLSNDVDISWNQFGIVCSEGAPENCPIIPILGAPRLVPDASGSGDSVLFDVVLSGEGNSDEIFQVDLLLHVADTSEMEIILPDGSPLQLTFTHDFSQGNLQAATLGQFTNFNLLPQGETVLFTVDADFRSSLFPGVSPALVTVSGAGTEYSSVQPIPEPSTLLLLGSGAAEIVRRRYRRR
jgi:hypothetical protein